MVLQKLSTTWRNVALAAVGALLLWFLWSVRSALNPLGVGLLLAYMLHPMVTSLERHGWSRRLAVNVIFAATGLAGIVLSLALSVQARQLWADVAKENGALSKIDDKVAAGVEELYGKVDPWLERLNVFEDEGAGAEAEGGEFPDPEDPAAAGEEGAAPDIAAEITERQIKLEDVYESLRAWLVQEGRLEQAGEASLRAAGGMWVVFRRLFGSLLTFGGYLILVPIYTWFLLFELERISGFVRTYIPRGERERFASIGSQIAEMLGHFFRGRMLVCLLKGLVLAAVLAMAGIPYALLVGVISGFLSLVPFVGPFLGYGLAFLLGLLEFSVGECVIRIAVVYTIGEAIEGYVLLPRVLGDSLGLHPIVVIASLMVFGAALGMFGMLLALPLTSTAVILATELVLPALRDVAEGRQPTRSGGEVSAEAD